jgi:hypothetical protein
MVMFLDYFYLFLLWLKFEIRRPSAMVKDDDDLLQVSLSEIKTQHLKTQVNWTTPSTWTRFSTLRAFSEIHLRTHVQRSRSKLND